MVLEAVAQGIAIGREAIVDLHSLIGEHGD